MRAMISSVQSLRRFRSRALPLHVLLPLQSADRENGAQSPSFQNYCGCDEAECQYQSMQTQVAMRSDPTHGAHGRAHRELAFPDGRGCPHTVLLLLLLSEWCVERPGNLRPAKGNPLLD